MTYFLKSGERYNVSTQGKLDIHKILPVGTYTVGFDQMSGAFYLEGTEGFSLPSKLYGTTTKDSERILKTFLDRPASTGVMLSGEKGSGKTLLAKKLSIDGQAQGIPTIVINQSWHGEGFNLFMQMIEQPVVVVFDEFEKVYDSDEQEQLLTLLDGVYPSKKLYVITTNDKYRVDRHMQNRPGRIFYRLEFTGLDADFIREYCEDTLDNKSHIEGIVNVAAMFGEFNFDILKALVEEMNRYNESPKEAMRMLNAKPENSDDQRYELSLSHDDTKVSICEGYQWFDGNPLADHITAFYTDGSTTTERKRKRVTSPETVDDLFGNTEVAESPKRLITRFKFSDFVGVEEGTGVLRYKNSEGFKLRLTKAKPTVYDWAF